MSKAIRAFAVIVYEMIVYIICYQEGLYPANSMVVLLMDELNNGAIRVAFWGALAMGLAINN